MAQQRNREEVVNTQLAVLISGLEGRAAADITANLVCTP